MSDQKYNSKTPEEYREELMRLYQSHRPIPPTNSSHNDDLPPAPPQEPPAEAVPEPPQPPILPEPTPEPEPQPTPTPMPEPPEQQPVVQPDLPPMEPEPVMEESETPPQEPDVLSEQPLPDDLPPGLPGTAPTAPYTSSGWLKVIVRTGNNAMPLPGVTVMISGHSTGEMLLQQVSITDESGETERIPLPAPELSESFTLGGSPAYSVYSVSVYAPGYYRAESSNVPVFPGITSLQQFNMIPLPLFNNGESDSAPPYQNTEPIF